MLAAGRSSGDPNVEAEIMINDATVGDLNPALPIMINIPSFP